MCAIYFNFYAEAAQKHAAQINKYTDKAAIIKYIKIVKHAIKSVFRFQQNVFYTHTHTYTYAPALWR